MASRTVLSIGQCRPDHAAISHFLKSNFDVDLHTADLADEAIELMARQTFHLVLVNRKLDADYSDGMDIIRRMKATAELCDLPVMLVSNFPDWQEKAVQLGAVPGFGKAELGTSDTIDRVRAILAIP
ncbi:MAG: hypothetical protein KDA81_15225 [Planctomycetaceae bacterium]|nr:hypothetical protein [Planctomycetaceae bacterium]